MKYVASLAGLLLGAFALVAQETPSLDPAKADYTELSKMIRTVALKEAPKEFRPAPAWGLSTPFPPKLRLPGLPRTTIKNGDHLELAHGSWKRARVTMENPERDFVLNVTDLTVLEASKYRVSITSIAPLNIDYEFQQWLNGLMLVGLEGRAKARVKVDIDCEVVLTLNALKLPPEITVAPKITSTKIEVQDLEVFNPATANRPDRAQNINGELRNFVQGLVRDAEPNVQEEANKAIVRALRDGKGTFSAAKLFEASQKK